MEGRAPEVAVAVSHLGKCYRIYDRPQDRLKQALFRGRRQYYREFWALRDVSLEVRRGETVGIMGRNGCGKSTLLQMACGTLHPTTGQIHMQGRVAALLELGAGFNPEFSGRDNVYTNAAILGLSQREIKERFDQIVDFSELEEFIDRPVKTYSSGMFVRLAFAVAISVDPDILVVDEALAVGDEAFQRKCFARIQELQRKGATILFVSHSAGTIVELCSRAVLLDHGELLMTGAPKEVVARYHKLIYAPAAKVPAIREAIRRGEDPIVTQMESPAGQTPAAAPSAHDNSRAVFDADMKPASTVSYERNGAEIVDARITTRAGRPVNLLMPGEEYEVRYRVLFTRPGFAVRWGAMLKNKVGTEISGGCMPHLSSPVHDFVAAGTEAELAFPFRCQLMPGVYFANVGLMGSVDGQPKYLHRIEDALMFRVQIGDTSSAAGMVDLFLPAQIALANPAIQEAA